MKAFRLPAAIILTSLLLGGSFLTVFTPTSHAEAASKVTKVKKYCCKICSAGKACGNSCISRKYTCHKAPGCACNG